MPSLPRRAAVNPDENDGQHQINGTAIVLPQQFAIGVDRSFGSGLKNAHARTRAYCYKNHQSFHAEKLTKIIHPSQYA
jgi:hypothetical protein